MIIIIGAVLLIIALLASSEQWRRGVLADDDEIRERAERGESGCGLMILALLAGFGALALLGMAGAL